MRKLIPLFSLLAACGFSDDELGLIASAVLHSVEQARADVEGLDLDYFGQSGLVAPTTTGAFQVAGQTSNSCGGAADVSGSGKRASGKLDYAIKLELADWAGCNYDVQISGSVDARVIADDVTVSDFRERASTAKVTGEVRARGDDIASDNRDVAVGFDLTMVTRPGLAQPETSGTIDGVDL